MEGSEVVKGTSDKPILTYQSVYHCTKVCCLNITDCKGSDTTWEFMLIAQSEIRPLLNKLIADFDENFQDSSAMVQGTID